MESDVVKSERISPTTIHHNRYHLADYLQSLRRQDTVDASLIILPVLAIGVYLSTHAHGLIMHDPPFSSP